MADPACVRKAWLTLGDRRLELEDPAAAYFCTQLDLGDPDVRDVTHNRPDADGTDDLTRLMGARAITADITARPKTLTADEIATVFAPFMLPALRPRLHFVLDVPGAPERFTTVRKAGYTWPVTGKAVREIHLQWVAADPYFYDAAERSATAWAGAGGLPDGVTFDITFDLTFPAGGGQLPTVGWIEPAGDTWPALQLRIWGPIVAPIVSFDTDPAAQVVFLPGVDIPAGGWVDVDCAARTATDPAGTQVLGAIDWFATTWPNIPPGRRTAMRLVGADTTGITQVVATWHDRYVT